MRVPARRWPRFSPGKGLKAVVRERPERAAPREKRPA
jgi:nucleoid DNA-binding protein